MTIGLPSNTVSPEVIVNQMVDGYFAKSVAGSSNVTLSDTEATWAIIELTGALTGNIEVSVADVMNTFAVINSTTGAYTITVKSATGTGVIVPQGDTAALYCDGTNVLQLGLTPTIITGKVLQSNTRAASTPASSAGTLTLDLSAGLEFNVTLTEAVTTLTLSNVPSGVSEFTLDLTQDGTGGWAVTWPASIQWAGGVVPTLTTTANANSVLKFRTKNGGTAWQGRLIGDDFQ